MNKQTAKKIVENFIRNQIRKSLKEEKATKLLREDELLHSYIQPFSKDLYEKWTSIDFEQYLSEEDIMEVGNNLFRKFNFPYSIIKVVIKNRNDYDDYFFKLKKI